MIQPLGQQPLSKPRKVIIIKNLIGQNNLTLCRPVKLIRFQVQETLCYGSPYLFFSKIILTDILPFRPCLSLSRLSLQSWSLRRASLSRSHPFDRSRPDRAVRTVRVGSHSSSGTCIPAPRWSFT